MDELKKALKTDPKLHQLIWNEAKAIWARYREIANAKDEAAATDDNRWDGLHYQRIGLTCLALLGLGLMGWAATSNIAGAIIASGKVAVDSNRQIVQHPTGGRVTEISVREGDLVNAGDVLIRLDASELHTELEIVQSQYHEFAARMSRLTAESSGESVISFPEDLIHAARRDPVLTNLLEAQTRLYATRADNVERRIIQLVQRKEQISAQINGVRAQKEATDVQLVSLREELETTRTLVNRSLVQRSALSNLERREAALFGEAGELEARIAELLGAQIEQDLEILSLRSDRQEEAQVQLSDISVQFSELSARRDAIVEQLDNLDIKAPVAGVVYDLQFFGPQSVMRPADPALYIVPQDSPLVIQAQVDPLHIDQIYPNQPVSVKFASFNQNETPDLNGRVSVISADTFIDEVTRQNHYEVEIVLSAEELERLGDQVLLPGMPVDSFIKTDARTPLSYFISPLANYFSRAFRES